MEYHGNGNSCISAHRACTTIHTEITSLYPGNGTAVHGLDQGNKIGCAVWVGAMLYSISPVSYNVHHHHAALNYNSCSGFLHWWHSITHLLPEFSIGLTGVVLLPLEYPLSVPNIAQ